MRKARFIPLSSTYATAPQVTPCGSLGCEHAGDFRAPKSPYHLQEYYWFCLDHVREYNKKWDFYRGMTSEEIEASRISDMTWNRPSWPVGGWRALLENAQYLDGLDPFLKMPSRTPLLPQPVQKALGILELALPITVENLKKQYKQLAKKHHPDLNPNDTQAEERLKIINEAYHVLRKHIAASKTDSL